MSRNWAWAVLVAVALLPGCNPPNSPAEQTEAGKSSAVGVVDLDRAASELGLTQQVTQIIQAEDQRLVAGLMDVKQKIQSQFDAKKKLAGETPSTKDKEELQIMEMQANQFLENIRIQSQARLQEVRGALVQQLRRTFSESVQEVAKSHQMKVVLTYPNDAVIYSAPTVDLTGELIESLRGKTSSIKLSAPALPESSQGRSSPPPATTGNPPASTTGTAPPAGTTTGQSK